MNHNTNKKVIEKSVSECCGAYPRWNSLIDEFVCQKCIKACRILPTPSSEKRIGGAEFHMFGQDYERNYSHTHCWNQGKSPACGQPLENHKQCCLCDTPSPQPSSWEDRFDARFSWERNAEGRGFLYDNLGQQTVDEVIIKDFISNLLLQAQTEVLKELKDAWEIEGSHPKYHREQKEHLRKYWFTLYEAIINLINK